jgi:DNA-binding CsgD family transcriptional regulator/GAF domain-containing protein
MPIADAVRLRARDTIARLSSQGLDLVTLWRSTSDALASVIPHYLSPCWFTLDPASLLVTSHYQDEIPELPPEWLAHEYYEDDAHKIAGVARSDRGTSTLHEATGGEPSRSPGWKKFMQPYGADQELLVALRTRTGDAWGMLGLYREPDRPLFDESEIAFLREISGVLADGARRALLIGEAIEPDGSDAPGLLVLRRDWTVESLSPGTEEWLDELPDGAWRARGALPSAVLAVAGRALRGEHAPHPLPAQVNLARVRTRAGRWVALHGSVLLTDGDPRVAVIIEPAQPACIATLLISAYGLTRREGDVTRLVLQGASTAEIASSLFISPQTVQQHLKSIFDKTDVRSRRELVGKLFFENYEPRLRDNERRTLDGLPARGGPWRGPSSP